MDIFDIKGTMIYFLGLPDRDYVLNNKVLKDGKKARDCASQSKNSGTEKEKLLLTGKAK